MPPTVAFTHDYPLNSIVIDTGGRKLYYVLPDGRAYAYAISVGREGFNWTGSEVISRKQEWPDWHPPAEMRERDRSLPVKMTGGLKNPLGALALYLGDTLYRIHGTNDAKSIGRAASSGCFRMLNAHVLHLASIAEIGTQVAVVATLPGQPTQPKVSEGPAVAPPTASAPQPTGASAPQEATEERKEDERRAADQRIAEAKRLEAERKELEATEAKRKEDERRAAVEAEAKRIAEAKRLEAERKQQEATEAKRKEDEQRVAAKEEAKRIAEAQRLEAERKQQERLEAKRKQDEQRAAAVVEPRRAEAQRPAPERKEREWGTGTTTRDYRALREYMLGR